MPQRLMPLIDNVSMAHGVVAPPTSATFNVNTTCGFCQRNSVTWPSTSIMFVVSNHADTL